VTIHLAARHFIPYCETHPLETLEVNVKGTANVLRAVASLAEARLILASSLAVYPPQEELLREDVFLEPIDIYGYSKWQAELVAQQIGAGSNLDIAIVRIGNVYGPLETNPHVIPHILEQLKLGDAIELGNLESRRDYIYVEDVVDALLALTTRRLPSPEVFNLSTGEGHTVTEILDELGRLLDRTLRPQPSPHLLRPVDRPMLRADSSRLRAAVEWRPRHSLRDGLRKLLIAEGLLQA
jgi:UDP-glucose 4-epimerase